VATRSFWLTLAVALGAALGIFNFRWLRSSLLAILPILGMVLFMGGVSPGEFWRMVLVLTNTLFLSLCTAMWVSSISQDARKAWGAALGLMLAILVGPWLVDCLIAFSIPKPSNAVFSVLSPFVAAELVYDVEYNAGPAHFWWSFFLIQLLSWGFLGVCRRAPAFSASNAPSAYRASS
jgi:hypothetical protein